MPAITSSRLSAKPPRRTQEDRTLAMRTRVLDAAIDCLHKSGFSATTTAAVAAAAGVSRGAMLHHFPSKDDLLVALVERVFSESLESYSARLAAIEDPVERLLAMPELAWEGMQAPGYMAWIEVWMATRSHDELRQRFRQAYAAINDRAAQGMRIFARQAGITDVDRVDRVWMLLLAAMRGLAIEAAISQDSPRFTPAIQEMRSLLELSLLGGPRPRPERGASRSGKKR